MTDFPRWLYSKDHGSVVVDTAEDAVNLPKSDWYPTPDFQGEPYILGASVDNLREAAAAASLVVQAEDAIADRVVEKLDKRTKAYRDGLR